MKAVGRPCDLAARLIIIAAMNRAVLAFADAIIVHVKPLVVADVHVISLVGCIEFAILIFTREHQVALLIIGALICRCVYRDIAL